MRSGASPLLRVDGGLSRLYEWQIPRKNRNRNKAKNQRTSDMLNLGGRTNMRLVRHMHSVGMLALVAGMPLTYTVRDCGGRTRQARYTV